MAVFRKDPCGVFCLMLTYLAIFYADYVVLRWIIMQTMIASMWGPFNAVCFFTVTFLAVISHLRAVFSDPGLVPFAKTRVDFSDKWDAGGETMRDVDWTMCSRCESYRPPRAHHCRICKRCVRKMDHHCPWINNCVGEWNRKYFIQFLVWIGVLSVYAVILVGVSWLAPPCITCDREETIVIKQSRVIHSVALVLEALLFGLFVAAIMCDQFSSILSDATAVEQVISKSEGNGLNTFRKPAMALLAEVFGRGSVWLWLFPCQSAVNNRYMQSSDYTV